jgi:hypothetical protein
MAETQAATPDDFVTYDELNGPDLDAAHWSQVRLPRPRAASTSRWTPTGS